MSDFYLDQERIADGCVIYRNPPKPGSKSKLWWYVRIRLQQEKRYIRKSLRTTDYDEAKRAAYKLYEDVRRDEYYGYKPDAVNLSQIMELYLQDRPNLSSERETQIRRIVRLYLSEYFKDKPIKEHAEDRNALISYQDWRVGYWERYRERIKTDPLLKDKHRRVSENGYGGLYKGERRTPLNTSDNPSRSTLELEYSIYNALMNFAKSNKYIPDFIQFERRNLPDPEPRYQAVYTFTKEEIQKIRDALVDEMRCDRLPVTDDKGIQLRDEWGDLRWNTFVSNPHMKRCRHNLRALILLILSSGIRPSEALDLRISEIGEGITDNILHGGNFRYLTLKIMERKSRRRHLGYRTVYVPYHMKKIIGRVMEINAPHNKPNDRLFSKADGSRYGLLSRRFKQLLQNLGIYESKEGARRTLTHLRSYYASDLLQHHPLHIVAAQMGHNIQTLFDFYTKIQVGKRAYSILNHIQQPNNIVHMAAASLRSDL